MSDKPEVTQADVEAFLEGNYLCDIHTQKVLFSLPRELRLRCNAQADFMVAILRHYESQEEGEPGTVGPQISADFRDGVIQFASQFRSLGEVRSCRADRLIQGEWTKVAEADSWAELQVKLKRILDAEEGVT